MYLEGPNTLREMRAGGERRTVVLLGEYHFQLKFATPQNLCPRDGKMPVLTVGDYFDVLFSSAPDKKFDLFMEIAPVRGRGGTPVERPDFDEINRRAALLAFRSYYYNCLLQRPNCQFQNVRFHYTDWRQRGILLSDVFDKYFAGDTHVTKIATLIQLNVGSPGTYKDYMLHVYHLEKQLRKTRQDVLQVIMKDLDELTEIAQSHLDRLKRDEDNDELSKDFVESMLDMWNSFVDYYTLARIFKPETSNNVIVYVGDRHRFHLQMLLDSLHYNSTWVTGGNTRDEPTYCLTIKKHDGFFFAPLADHPPLSDGYTELIHFLSRPTFSFETSWYASEYSIIRLIAIYFRRQTSVLTAYQSMKSASGFYFTFQRVKDTLALFVHDVLSSLSEPKIANALLLPTRDKIKLKDDSVRALFIYKDAYARLSPPAQMVLKMLIGETPEPPTSNLLMLLELKEH